MKSFYTYVLYEGHKTAGLPYSLSGSAVGNLVTSTLYNNLGQVTEINLNNGLRTTFGYWDTGGTYDTTGGYYGRLWEIKTSPQSGGTAIQDIKHTWDAGGNLTQREDVLVSETETFTYDFLDRLTSATGPYTESYTYDELGNITSKGGLSYTYGTKPHAVTAVGSTSYAYDANGNMTVRGSQTIIWDVENRPTTISDNGVIAQFVYDGDGKRIKKTEGGETIIYINQYYEKNVTTGEVTTSYYLGGRLIAQRQGTDLQYVHQDSLTGTSVMSDDTGASVGTIKYFPFGATRSGSVPTDKKFTGQRLDGTGLYYYGARYYDPSIGRFISVDPIIANAFNPQTINPYSYVWNNPLKYIDPSGCQGSDPGGFPADPMGCPPVSPSSTGPTGDPGPCPTCTPPCTYIGLDPRSGLPLYKCNMNDGDGIDRGRFCEYVCNHLGGVNKAICIADCYVGSGAYILSPEGFCEFCCPDCDFSSLIRCGLDLRAAGYEAVMVLSLYGVPGAAVPLTGKVLGLLYTMQALKGALLNDSWC